jgi:hypothetical protein
MKTTKLLFLLILVLCLAGCEKDDKPVTRPVEFTETTYLTLGTFDNSGRPNYLLTKDVISANLFSYITSTLPEHADLRNTHPELLSSSATADIAITQQSDVFITYVFNGSGTTNALGFYTYPTIKPITSVKDIKTITYVFPNAGSGSTLETGDKVKIGRFDVGTSIGFVLLQNAWNTANHELNNKVVHFCSNDILNPEVDPSLKKHAVLINYTPENKVLMGFEDLDRTSSGCDHDFNDVVVYATVTP